MPRKLAEAPVSQEDISRMLKKPDSFVYFGEHPMFESWSLGPIIRHRDSDAQEKRRADALERRLGKQEDLKGEWEITGHSHWAVGWVDHLSFRVIDDDGKPTRMARVMKALEDARDE